MKTERTIKEEILNFIDKVFPETSFNIVIKDDNGMELFNFLSPDCYDLIDRIYNDIKMFAVDNGCPECRTVEGLWNECKKIGGFGDILTLYYENEERDLIHFLEGEEG